MVGVVLIVVDAANVVGSVPDGWWRDRAGAAERLRDTLAAAGPAALPGADPEAEIVLVVEGAARRLAAVPGVRVVAAGGSGDDEIVALCRENRDDDIVVVTADRALRDRVTQLGARVVGPTMLRVRR
jgi:nucleotide-binding universal stress UspA family protein